MRTPAPLIALARDKHGLAATEFGLIAPVIVLLLFGAIELTYVSAARSTLEFATIRGGRMIAASDCPTTRKETMEKSVADSMSWVSSHNDEGPVVTAKSYGTKFGQVGQPEPFIDDPVAPNGKYDVGESFTDVNGNGKWDADMGVSGSVGDANQVVSYEATFKVKSLVPFIADALNDGRDHYVVSASTIVRNEPVFRTTGC
ncbi:TadE/TadG family type IV pilus assembly protein [Sphingomonas sp.]